MADKIVVLITGANQGLGYQIVRALCRSDESYEILVASRSLVKAQDAAKAAVNEFAPTKSRTWPIQVDIDDDTSISGAVHEVEAKFGRLDVLLNNAGRFPGEFHDEMLLELALGAQYDPQFQAGHITMRQAWTLSWQTNTVGTQIMTASFIPLLLKSANPRLLFVTSGTSGLTGTEDPDLPINVIPKKGWPKTSLTQQNNISAYRSSKTGMNMVRVCPLT